MNMKKSNINIMGVVKNHCNLQKELLNIAIAIAEGRRTMDEEYYSIKKKWQNSRAKLNEISELL